MFNADPQVMVFAGVSSDHEGFIGSRQFEVMQPGSAFSS